MTRFIKTNFDPSFEDPRAEGATCRGKKSIIARWFARWLDSKPPGLIARREEGEFSDTPDEGAVLSRPHVTRIKAFLAVLKASRILRRRGRTKRLRRNILLRGMKDKYIYISYRRENSKNISNLVFAYNFSSLFGRKENKKSCEFSRIKKEITQLASLFLFFFFLPIDKETRWFHKCFGSKLLFKLWISIDEAKVKSGVNILQIFCKL